MPRISIENQDTSRALELSQAVINIGRSELCEIRLDAPGVSRLHARLILEKGQITLEDMGSRNGTFVQGVRIESQILPPGQTFRIEQFTLKVELLPGEETLEPQLSVSSGTPLPRPAPPRDGASALYRAEDFRQNDLRRTADNPEAPPPAEAALPPSGQPQVQNPPPAIDLRQMLDLDINGPAESEAPAEVATPGQPAQHSLAKDKEEKQYRPTVRVPEATPPPESAEPSTPAPEEAAAPPGETLAQPAAAEALAPRPDVQATELNLLVTLPDGRRFTAAVERLPFLIGRHPDCHLVLDHSSVSSEHALLEQEESGAVVIGDLRSTNGTFMNGRRINQAPLCGGETLELGAATIEVQIRGAASEATWRQLPAQEAAPPPPLSPRPPAMLRLILIAASALAGGLILYQLRRPSQPRPAAPPSAAVSSPAAGQETARLVAYNLDQALTFKEEKKYEEALRKLNTILSSLQPNNEKALKLYNEVLILKEQEEAKSAEERRREQEKRDKIEAWLAKGQSALARQSFVEARAAAQEVLDLDGKNVSAKQLLLNVAEREKKLRQNQAARQEQRRNLGQKLEQGLLLLDKGSLAEGERLLREVVAAGQSEYYNQAKAALEKLEQDRLGRLRNLLTDAQIQYEDGNLAGADKILRQILSQAPDYLEAKRMHKKIRKETRAKAEKLFNEARVMETTLEDVESALAKYREVLTLLPDAKEPLNQKAKKRIRALRREE